MKYREVKAVNKSLMDVYEDDYTAFVAYWVNNIALPEKDRDYLTLGSIVDTLLTKAEDYHDLFATFKGKAPTAPLMLKFCKELDRLYTMGLPLESYYSLAYEAAGISTPKLEGFVARFEEFKPYFGFLQSSKGKTVISKEQGKQAGTIVEQLRNNRYTRDIVNATNTETGEVHNQLELYHTYRGIPLKGALDRVLVSHKHKQVHPIDFKSSYNVLDFRNSYYKYRYYRQGSYYTYLLQQWMNERGIGDYNITPFQFVVCSTSGGQHWRYVMDPVDIEKARVGGETMWGQPIKGWGQILDEIGEMTKLGEWAFPFECLRSDGVMDLNIFK